ncbi:LysR family transcriptional regulator [Pannonibacter phragmitetus]|uniref:LysR family transcriptional regulator n=1 Tax=Pannonibacter phragmitetus TaxID=121719 RepID=A0A0L0J1W3_9HYPH|nr:LysR family transcriptional regulator [Pannonibacter phragmitetus]ALV27109.1 LysR family transcriptional regulator [Pannonibacter phragmitetus]KND19592.1 LysR family transcriptional regulator [Pannonibacter phragmitetus]
MPDLNYHHLRYFRAVAHDGNLTRTAERLNLSQSALSVQIRQLEERLGHALFERRGRQLHLTEAGRIALDHADAIFSAGEELIATLRQTGTTRQVLRVGGMATLSRNFQIAFLRPVLGRADVEVVLRSGSPAELLHQLETLNLDVVLLTRPPENKADLPFVAHKLAEQPVSLIGRPDALTAGLSLGQYLASAPLILPTRDSSVRTGFDALAARLDVNPQIAAEVDDMAMMRLLAREGLGLAVMPPIVVRDELASGLLREIDRLEGLTESFYAVTLSRRFPNPLLRDLIAARPADFAAGNDAD